MSTTPAADIPAKAALALAETATDVVPMSAEIDTNMHPSPNVLPRDAALTLPFERAQPLAPDSFPNPPRAGLLQVPATIANVRHLLDSHGILARYDVIRKREFIVVPGQAGSPDNADNVAISHLVSLATLNGMSANRVPEFVAAIADMQSWNPVAEWILSKPWDHKDRFPALCETLVHHEEFPPQLKELLLHRWLLSAVAAALQPVGFRSRGVLTLQGPQSIGKTQWIAALVSDPLLGARVVKVDHHLDAGNKDSLLTAIGHWMVEMGELESSLRRDLPKLKGFLTAPSDKVRRPYGRTDSEYSRRTVFCATVNDAQFLIDPTGNTRFWTIPVTKIDYKHGIDMQQVFAQLAEEYESGQAYWLTKDEEAMLELHNAKHRTVSAIRERILAAVNHEKIGFPNLAAYTPTDLLRQLGIVNPSNSQAKECGAVLRELLGESKRINGFNCWRVPLHDAHANIETLSPLPPPGRKASDF